jgi:hypothetical protein
MSTAELILTIEGLFQAHQARLAAVAAAHGAGGLSPSLRKISATCLSMQIQGLVKAQYTRDCAAGSDHTEKIARLAASAADLAKQVRPVAANDAFYEAFTIGNEAAAQEVFLSIFGLKSAS